MMNTAVTALNHTLTETHEWLAELVRIGPFENEQQAYSHFRAVLHAIRDRLTIEEAVHLAAQLPMLVRGFYYEGWRPALAPNEHEGTEAFFESVRSSLHDTISTDDQTEPAARAVFALLTGRLSEGQVRHVRGQLSEAVRKLWQA